MYRVGAVSRSRTEAEEEPCIGCFVKKEREREGKDLGGGGGGDSGRVVNLSIGARENARENARDLCSISARARILSGRRAL